MSVENIAESICQAADTIIAQRLNRITFDKTIQCKIQKAVENFTDRFIVSSGSLVFEAQALGDSKYNVGEYVYVLIPEGDYNNNKIIIGNKSSSETATEYDVYAHSFDNIIPTKVFDILSNNDMFSITAEEYTNGVRIKSITAQQDEVAKPLFSYGYNTPNDYIGLSMGISIDNENLVKGRYFLEIDFLDSTGTSVFKDQTNKLYWNSTDLFGNPYEQIRELKQEFLFLCPEGIPYEKIYNIKISLFMDDEFNEATTINIYDLRIVFGYKKENLFKPTIMLNHSLSEPQEYSAYGEEILKTRQLNLQWFEYNENRELQLYDFQNKFQAQPNKYEEMVDKIEAIKSDYTILRTEQEALIDKIISEYEDIIYEYKVHWLTYVRGSGDNKYLPKAQVTNWQYCVYDENDKSINTDYQYTVTLNMVYKTDEYKAVVSYLTCKDKYLQELTKDDYTQYLYSNPLVFNSKDVYSDPGATNGAGDTLKIYVENNSAALFNYYGIDNRLIETSKRGPYTVFAEPFDALVWEDNWSELDNSNIKSVKWKYPTESTMIEEVKVADNQKSLTFSIKQTLFLEATNNSIECIVHLKSGEIRQGILNLHFGPAKINGTNFSFFLDFIGEQRYLTLAEEKASEVRVKAYFCDASGNEILGYDIDWDWAYTNTEIKSGDENLPYFGKDEQLGYFTLLTQENINNEVVITYDKNYFPTIGNYAILKATINNQATGNGALSDLTVYLAIPLGKANTKARITGATRVVYDTIGKQYSKSSDRYEYYENDEAQADILWDLQYPENLATNGIPALNNQNLYPVSYAPEELPPVSLMAFQKENEDAETINICWMQPILILHDAWASQMINEWDGSVEIDEEAGAIKSPMFMAGKKDLNNTFTGVLIGDVIHADIERDVGLYGFQQGKERFYFTECGEVFLGNREKDFYITLDSNGNFVIKTNTFNLNTQGLTIDSEARQIQVYEDDDNTRLKVQMGKITKKAQEKDVYGLDIFRGAFRVYTCDYTGITPDPDNLAINFEYDERDKELKMYMNGLLTRTARYSNIYTPSNNNDKNFNYSYSNEVTTILGDQREGLNVYFTSLSKVDNSDKEDWFSGLTLRSSFNFYQRYRTDTSGNPIPDTLEDGTNTIATIGDTPGITNSTTYAGYVSGKNNAMSFVGAAQSVPYLALTQGTNWPSAYYMVNNQNDNRNYYSSTNNVAYSYMYLTTSVSNRVMAYGAPHDSWYNKDSSLTGLYIKSSNIDTPKREIDLCADRITLTDGNTNRFVISFHSIAAYVWDSTNKKEKTTTLKILNGVAIDGNLLPNKTETYKLGSSSYKWNEIWSAHALNTASDKALKKNISLISSKYKQLFTKLIPVSYNFTYPNSDRIHIGFVAQDVEAAMNEVGLTALDFGGFCKDIKTEIIDEKEVPVLDKDGKPQYIYSLRYEEFIGIITAVLQDTNAQLENIEKRLSQLESKK